MSIVIDVSEVDHQLDVIEPQWVFCVVRTVTMPLLMEVTFVSAHSAQSDFAKTQRATH